MGEVRIERRKVLSRDWGDRNIPFLLRSQAGPLSLLREEVCLDRRMIPLDDDQKVLEVMKHKHHLGFRRNSTDHLVRENQSHCHLRRSSRVEAHS